MSNFEPLLDLIATGANAELIFQGRPDLKTAYVKLTRAYRKQPARGVLDHFRSYADDCRVATVDELENSLSFLVRPRDPIIRFLKQLQDMEWGEYRVGRKGGKTRFVSPYSLKTIGQLAKHGQAGNGTALSREHDEAEPEDSPGEDPGAPVVPDTPSRKQTSVEEISHKFPLRPGYTLTLSLPVDLTAAEAARLADFVKSLPFH